MTTWVSGIERAIRSAAEQLLRETGFCLPPTVHMLAEDLDPPYLGHIISREFYRGADAAAAISWLGILPSVLATTRLVVTWEDADLRTALTLPGGPFSTGMAVLDASLTGHTLRWHPFRMHLGPRTEAGLPTVRPEWTQSAQYPEAPLLDPIQNLLRLWRQRRSEDLQQTVQDLHRAGHRMTWAQRSPVPGHAVPEATQP